ncbi:hypothetical protein EVAR_78676_1 [Eumeta japonica]|uniref:Uncharacterized protein n=1 Tax=Eumeta variegata TaxID=151549 RepID=A0A4C1U868_EUMVA|nr:hypothetical protein EVAR_78676_1 [Eumeta japonica]
MDQKRTNSLTSIKWPTFRGLTLKFGQLEPLASEGLSLYPDINLFVLNNSINILVAALYHPRLTSMGAARTRLRQTEGGYTSRNAETMNES